MRQANILDKVHEELPSNVWDDPASPKPTLKPQHAQWITNHIFTVLDKHGYSNPEKWLQLVLTGSLTTYQYGPDSDCDVSLFVDHKALPEWSRAEMIGLMIHHTDGVTLPGTSYPMQCYVVSRKLSPADLYKPGLRSGYDIRKHHWIEPPDPARSHNVEQQENAFYVYALEQADKMERMLRYEPDKAISFWHQIHQRRQRDQQSGKGDFALSNIVYKFLAQRGLFPAISQASGEYIAKTAETIPMTEPIRPHELSSPTAIERGHSRPVSPEEWHQIAEEGRQRYEEMASNADGSEGLNAQWPWLKEHAWNSVQEPWGGATINAATGAPLAGNEDLYALTVKPPGTQTVSIPINASREHFMSAMDEAKARFAHLLERANHHLGVFRDEDVNRIDFDPVAVTDNRQDAESIGAHTRNVGGAYHFASGDGFWPPHVPDEQQTLAAGAGPWPSFAQFRSANRTELSPEWWPEGTPEGPSQGITDME